MTHLIFSSQTFFSTYRTRGSSNRLETVDSRFSEKSQMELLFPDEGSNMNYPMLDASPLISKVCMIRVGYIIFLPIHAFSVTIINLLPNDASMVFASDFSGWMTRMKRRNSSRRPTRDRMSLSSNERQKIFCRVSDNGSSHAFRLRSSGAHRTGVRSHQESSAN